MDFHVLFEKWTTKIKKGRQEKVGALKEISDAAILYILSTVYTEGLYESNDIRRNWTRPNET